MSDIIQLSDDHEKNLSFIEGGRLAARRRKSGNLKEVTGAFFTPPTIVVFTIERTMNLWFEKTINEYKTDKDLRGLIHSIIDLSILDPASGSGLFLVGCRQYLRENAQRIIKSTSADTTLLEKLSKESKVSDSGILELNSTSIGSVWDRWIVKNILWGIEVNSNSLNLAKKIISSELKYDELNLLCANSMKIQIEAGIIPENGLSISSWSGGKKWDILIGNPPWGIEIPHIANGDYSLCKSESALAFVQLGFRLVKSDGLISFVMPSSWLQSITWAKWREKNLSLIKNFEINLIKSKVFEANYTAPPAVIIFSKVGDNKISCANIKIVENKIPRVVSAGIVENWKDYLKTVKRDDLYRCKLSEIVRCFPSCRVPVASEWWIKKLYLEENSIFLPLRHYIKTVIRGIKTGENAKYIQKYGSETQIIKSKENFSQPIESQLPSWILLAKGGRTTINGKPTHFIQPTSHIIRWDTNAFDHYKKSNGLRNMKYYGVEAIGFPSSGKKSPIFRFIRGVVFDADFIVFIAKKESMNLALLAILNSPAFLYNAKHLINQSSHFKAADLLDTKIPLINAETEKELGEYSQKIIDSYKKDNNEEIHDTIFKKIHDKVCDLYSLPKTERENCLGWYLERFPGMRNAFIR